MPSFIVPLNLFIACVGTRHVAAIAPWRQYSAPEMSQIVNDRHGAALYYSHSCSESGQVR
jgi:hypothetical protein